MKQKENKVRRKITAGMGWVSAKNMYKILYKC